MNDYKQNLVIKFSGLSDYINYFSTINIFPESYETNINITSISEACNAIGDDETMRIILDTVIARYPEIGIINNKYARVHYHGDNLYRDICNNNLYLCCHEKYDTNKLNT